MVLFKTLAGGVDIWNTYADVTEAFGLSVAVVISKGWIGFRPVVVGQFQTSFVSKHPDVLKGTHTHDGMM